MGVFLTHSVDALNVLCAQLTRDLFGIAEFLFVSVIANLLFILSLSSV